MGLLMGGLLTYALVYGIQSSINASVERKKDSVMSEFPKVISKLTLLINAGMLVGCTLPQPAAFQTAGAEFSAA